LQLLSIVLQLLRISIATYNYYTIKYYINNSTSKYCIVLYIYICVILELNKF